MTVNRCRPTLKIWDLSFNNPPSIDYLVRADAQDNIFLVQTTSPSMSNPLVHIFCSEKISAEVLDLGCFLVYWVTTAGYNSGTPKMNGCGTDVLPSTTTR